MTSNITFGFEKLETENEFISIQEIIFLKREKVGNLSGIDESRFRFSQVLDSLFHYHLQIGKFDNLSLIKVTESTNEKYIIPIAVNYHPLDWTDFSRTTSVFEYLNSKFLKDLQDGKAMLMLDQSVEGYSTFWLWEWFHKKCFDYNIDPSAIIYFTGDQSCKDSYEQWCANNSLQPKLNIFPSTSLSMYVNQHYFRFNLEIKFEKILDHKIKNLENIYLYDCINMRPRLQRVLNYLFLANNNLLEHGNISMPAVADWSHWTGKMGVNEITLNQYKLPLNIMDCVGIEARLAKHNHSNDSEHYWVFVERILSDLYLNSWLSIVTESSYFKNDHAVFLSEKTFKPIASLQPFIIVGSKHSLKYLRKLGYKTFSPYIDESYDDLDDEDRIPAIMNSLKKIQQIEDKVSWLQSMREILEHNQNLFMSITRVESDEYKAIKKCWNSYFVK